SGDPQVRLWLGALRGDVGIQKILQNFTARALLLDRGKSTSKNSPDDGASASHALTNGFSAVFAVVRSAKSSLVMTKNSRFRRLTSCGPDVSALSRTSLNFAFAFVAAQVIIFLQMTTLVTLPPLTPPPADLEDIARRARPS